jgi:hypothetical protein
MNSKVFWRLNEAYQLGVCNQIEEETLTEEELLGLQEWVEALIEEGYNLDEYSDDELYEAYLAEANSGDDFFKQFYSGRKKVKGLKTYQPGQNRFLAQQNAKRSAERYAKDMGRDRTPSYSDYEGSSWGSQKENLDLYDLVSEYLVSEGFCDSYEDADVIMVNMSEEWREGILEEVLDEANKLEKHLNLSPDETVRRRQDQDDLGGRRPRRTSRGSGQVKGGDPSLGVSVWKGGRKPSGDLDRGRDIDHKRSRGVKKKRGKVTRSMRGPNYNVGNYLAARYGED